MRRILLCFSLLQLSAVAAFSQKKFPEFGKIDVADLQLTGCPFEKDAVAMKLFDLQETEFNLDGFVPELRTERRVRIKIFKSEGYKYASIKIPFFSKYGMQKIRDLKGIVYNLDEAGNVVATKLEKKDFLKNQVEDAIQMINFTFPNLKSGSVFEYQYTKVERENTLLEPWIVQEDIPVAYALKTLIIPARSRIREKVSGLDSVQRTTEKFGNDRVKKMYYKEAIPSFHLEPYMGSLNDNLLHVKFLFYPYGNLLMDLLSTPEKEWKFTASRLLESKWLGGQVDTLIPETVYIIDSAKKMSSKEQRIAFIYEEVKRRLAGTTRQTFRAYDISEAWKTAKANTAETNLILLNLLRKAEVESYPLLISTRSNGKINTDFPSTAQFNGLDVLAVDTNRSYVLDASTREQSHLNPPFNVMNRIALLLDKDDSKWVRIVDERPLLRQEFIINAAFDEEACIDGMATIRQHDFAKSFAVDSTAQEKNENDQFGEKAEGLAVYFRKATEGGRFSDPLEQQADFLYQPQKTGEFYFLNPLFLFPQKVNPFKNSQRNTEIDMGCNQQITITMTLQLPASYQIEFLPKNTLLRAPDTSFYYKRVCSTDATSIFFAQTFEIKRSVFDKEEYPAVQEFFKRAYALMTEEIILKKRK